MTYELKQYRNRESGECVIARPAILNRHVMLTFDHRRDYRDSIFGIRNFQKRYEPLADWFARAGWNDE